MTTPAPRLSEIFLDAPERLDRLLGRLLASSPRERPTSAAEVSRELREIATELEGRPGDRLTRDAHFELSDLAHSSRSGGTRLVTTLVATHLKFLQCPSTPIPIRMQDKPENSPPNKTGACGD